MGLFSRFRQDEGERRSATIREWVCGLPGVTLIEQASPRSVVKVAGVIDALRVRPRNGIAQIEAQISDGSGSVTACWLGRRSIPGMALGMRLILDGRLAGKPGALEMLNPAFEFGPRQGD